MSPNTNKSESPADPQLWLEGILQKELGSAFTKVSTYPKEHDCRGIRKGLRVNLTLDPNSYVEEVFVIHYGPEEIEIDVSARDRKELRRITGLIRLEAADIRQVEETPDVPRLIINDGASLEPPTSTLLTAGSENLPSLDVMFASMVTDLTLGNVPAPAAQGGEPTENAPPVDAGSAANSGASSIAGIPPIEDDVTDRISGYRESKEFLLGETLADGASDTMGNSGYSLLDMKNSTFLAVTSTAAEKEYSSDLGGGDWSPVDNIEDISFIELK